MLKVIIVNVLCLAAGVWTYDRGQAYAPEIMASPVMASPLIMGAVCLVIWLAWWSYRMLRPKSAEPADDAKTFTESSR